MIELSRRGGIAVLTMAHGKANALDIEFCDAIVAEFNRLRGAPERAVVLTGQGGMFSAGVNLLKLSDGGVDYVRRFLPALHRLYETIFFFGKPVIAAVNGHAIAGGCVLECCADKRISLFQPREHDTKGVLGTCSTMLRLVSRRIHDIQAFFEQHLKHRVVGTLVC